MTKSLRTSFVALAVITVGACGKDDNKPAAPSVDVLAQDTTLHLAPALRADQDLGPQDILAVAAPPSAAATASAPAPSTEQRPARAQRRTATRHASLASSPTRLVRARTASERTHASRRAVATSSPTSRATRSRAARSQAQSTNSVLADAGVKTDAGLGPATTEAHPSSTIQRTSRRAVVAAGSELALQAERRVCTNTATVGDRFDAVLVEQVTGPSGAVIPKGATAVALVSSVQNSNAQNGGGIDLQIESLTFNGRTYPVHSKVTDTELDRLRSTSRGSDLAKVAAGTVLGAGMGKVLGRNTRSTVIGGASGAVAGAVLASRSQTYNTCLPDGGRITAQLVRPLTIEAAE